MPVTNYYTVGGHLKGQRVAGGSRHDYVPDALGSTVASIEEASGTSSHAARYKPYGADLSSTGTDRPFFGWAGTLGYLRTLRPVADHYVRARHYASGTGQWVTTDPLWPEERAYAYAYGNPTTLSDGSGLQGRGGKKGLGEKLSKKQIEKMDNYAKVVATRLKPCVSKAELGTVSRVFACIIFLESNFKKNVEAEGVHDTAYGIFQLGTLQYNDCSRSRRCKGKIKDAHCQIEAATNLWISMCNDPHTPKKAVAPVPRDPLSAYRGYWGCIRETKEGRRFGPLCLVQYMKVELSAIRSLTCPPKSKDCPGCRSSWGVRYR